MVDDKKSIFFVNISVSLHQIGTFQFEIGKQIGMPICFLKPNWNVPFYEIGMVPVPKKTFQFQIGMAKWNAKPNWNFQFASRDTFQK